MKHHGFRHFVVWLLLAALLLLACGCTSTNRVTVPPNEAPVGSNFKIASVILKDGAIVRFDNSGGVYVERTIDGKSSLFIVGSSSGKIVEIDPAKALEVNLEQTTTNGTGSFFTGLLLGMPIGVGILVLIASIAYGGH